MHPAVLRRFLFRRRRRLLAQKVALHNQDWSRARIEEYQVQRFNSMWARCLVEVPFYRSWQAENALPDRIERPTDLHQFPLLDRNTILTRADEIFENGTISSAYLTGGSTGRPTRFPRGAQDAVAMYANAYLTRNWWGFEPFDPITMIWGHSHLFGARMRGRMMQRRRRVADRVLNITRLDAYDLTDGALAHDYQQIVRSDPLYLIGYTSAVFRLAKYMQQNHLTIPAEQRLRAVVLTAEMFTAIDVEVVESAFGVRVVSEYGAAETGPIAASRHHTTPLQVIWDSFICLVDGRSDLVITTLEERRFPLINYQMGDRVQGRSSGVVNSLEFDSVIGRKQDVFNVFTLDGAPLVLGSFVFISIIKQFPGILGVQYHRRANSVVEIRVQAAHQLSLVDLSAFFVVELRRDHPNFDERSVQFVQVDEMVKTLAGKHANFAP